MLISQKVTDGVFVLKGPVLVSGQVSVGKDEDKNGRRKTVRFVANVTITQAVKSISTPK